MQGLLSKVSRYEALFELTGAINASSDIETVGDALARKLKYIADVYAWRYVCIDGNAGQGASAGGEQPKAILVDGHRGRASVVRTDSSALSDLEVELWNDRKTRLISGKAMSEVLDGLPTVFHKNDIEQISVNTLVEDGNTRALYLFCRRRKPFSELDVKCLSMVCGFFHSKVHTLWEQQKLRDLELAYLQQEVMLRQNERLATLGRLSAGMAHELNNPAAVVRQGAEHLRTAVARLEHARFALGAANLRETHSKLIQRLEMEAEERAKQPSTLDPIVRSDLEAEVESWLEQNGVEEPWEHASTLVTMGLCATEIGELTGDFGAAETGIVINYLSSRFTVYTLIEEIGHGAGRMAEIVRALKGYSFMDQAPIQAVDVREGIDATLVMLSSRLRDGVKLNVEYQADLPRIQAYGGELNQVWTNLIDNAISAMNGQGTLGLRVYANGNWIVVEVSDDGHGIPADVQEKIFDPFFTTKAPGEGTGLGLNISHGIIVEKHDGEISVESKPGETRFTVKLPLTPTHGKGD
jgi:signal transduction histidine kinase